MISKQRLLHFSFFSIIFLLLLSSTTITQAQNSEVGLWLGSGTYFGDLNRNNHLLKSRPAGGILYRYTVNDYMGLKATASFSQLAHADSVANAPFQEARNLSFKTNVIEVSGQVELHFQKFIAGSTKDFFSPYITAGLGLMHFNPKAKLNGDWFNLNELGTEGQLNADFTGVSPYKKIQLIIPVGIGFKYWMRKNWSFFMEAGYRFTTTDYLDDVSSVYVDPFLIGGTGSETSQLSDRSGEVQPEPIGVTGRQRGDTTNKDGYLLLNVGLTYTIFNRKCKGVY